MELWTAFLLGFVGSAHCAGMCGPLALALPVTENSQATFVLGRVLYNAGRMMTYGAMGGVFGGLGQGLAMAGLQRWVSIAAGVIILASLLVSSRFALGLPATTAVGWLKSGLGKLLATRSLRSVFLLGLLNGLLPCGLVYAACAGATASGNSLNGAACLLAFGLGTVPMMLGLSLAGPRLLTTFRFKLQRFVPVSLAVVGGLLILRGLALGIPYLSPARDAACCR
ncbi:MAG: sulfite exporter TauE/SafE family protein [Verrucomicrobia bacterium]|nr:sulfite exporter TauE/SafE family protein [Verrucomicrobiota bacterium]NBU11110.1 sulfite exporter TauE/SafE family protein [Pseudomonadota bacterium]NDA67401.1 sulfite exporter TauE/SafE family protein [Verrucomicrobiota bacterium]NDB76102.1 sulfite exporter TauE/SafE family protein [Verrucomicrobiota bacterium]NDE99133.1 sulfite exporter TauE/SafE family protein [Verrucomicrobiota bacterium]